MVIFLSFSSSSKSFEDDELVVSSQTAVVVDVTLTSGIIFSVPAAWSRFGFGKSNGRVFGETGTDPKPEPASSSPPRGGRKDAGAGVDASLRLGIAAGTISFPSLFSSSAFSVVALEDPGRGVGGLGAGAALGFLPPFLPLPLPLSRLPPFSFAFTIARGAGIRSSLFLDRSADNGGASSSSSSSSSLLASPSLSLSAVWVMSELNNGGGTKLGESGEVIFVVVFVSVFVAIVG